ncbi:hypothetical protein [Azospira restricta]|uniref:DUF4198 domain-containing protein n=1 Tax=Azospira restricta TaxID=404405 RepID=A0A974PW11_9RHOO|nr:hypothetical protein [Azospira restricta]QRJ62118.1 hypothetical protein IWH25_09860 [Azospira restricta]
MKTLAALAVAALLAAAPTFAHNDHTKPRHGGAVADAVDFQAELVAQPDRLTLYIREHGNPLATAGGTAKLTLLAAGKKTEVALPPAGDNRFEAQGSFAAKGAKAIATVQLPGKPAKTLRYALD